MEIVPIFVYGNDCAKKLDEVLRVNEINKVMIIWNNTKKFSVKEVSQFVWNLRKNHSDISVEMDLCICGEQEDGQCRVIENDQYNREKTLDKFVQKMNKCIKCGVDRLVLSDMNIDTLQLVSSKTRESKIELSTEVKMKSNLYNVFRKKNDMPIVVKDYHLSKNYLSYVERVLKITPNVILKPALLSNNVQNILVNRNDVVMSAFVTTAESEMMQYMHESLGISFVKEMIDQFRETGFSSIYLPLSLLYMEKI